MPVRAMLDSERSCASEDGTGVAMGRVMRWLSFLLSLLVLSACAPQAHSNDGFGPPSGDDASGDDDAGDFLPSGDDDASDSFVAPDSQAADASTGDDASIDLPPAPPFDAGLDGLCSTPVAPGDLVIDELMISSVSGSGDYGEWLEVRSTRSCALDIIGLHGDCPTGATVHSFDVTDDLWLEALGAFVVADSDDPVIDHALPGSIVVWTGSPGDVLRNGGDTVSLSMNGTLIDTVTYPALKLVVGTSVAFPSDCPASARSVWTNWKGSTASWFPGFFGTPNGPNDDVHCP
jgi:hypothetical protein